MAYVIEFLAENGDLVDLEHLCGSFCAMDAERKYADSPSAIVTEYPVRPETDYDVWCAECGDFIRHGISCECDDTDTPREPVEVLV